MSCVGTLYGTKVQIGHLKAERSLLDTGSRGNVPQVNHRAQAPVNCLSF